LLNSAKTSCDHKVLFPAPSSDPISKLVELQVFSESKEITPQIQPYLEEFEQCCGRGTLVISAWDAALQR